MENGKRLGVMTNFHLADRRLLAFNYVYGSVYESDERGAGEGGRERDREEERDREKERETGGLAEGVRIFPGGLVEPAL